MAREILVGSRDSALALWQTEWVVNRLRELHPGRKFRIVTMKTRGDKILDVALAKIGDKGLFTKELELAMLRGEIDLAVHSMKDLPTRLPDGLTIGAICQRENPCDVFISEKYKSIESLPPGARVGTSSLRRCAQLLHYRPDLQLVPLRGNLNTRLRKLREQNLDGIILAAAGVIRLGWQNLIKQYLPYSLSLPAVGQGSIGVEMREGDKEIAELVAPLNDYSAEKSIKAERAFLRYLEGGCQIPIGALGQIEGGELRLQGVIASLDGKRLFRAEISGSPEEAEELGIALAKRLLAMGADEVLKELRQEIDANG